MPACLEDSGHARCGAGESRALAEPVRRCGGEPFLRGVEVHETAARRPTRSTFARVVAPRATRPRQSRRYSASALIGRLISARTASCADRFSYSTRYTMAHSGISTPARAATAWMARAAA